MCFYCFYQHIVLTFSLKKYQDKVSACKYCKLSYHKDKIKLDYIKPLIIAQTVTSSNRVKINLDFILFYPRLIF